MLFFFGLFFAIISINSGEKKPFRLLAEDANITDFPYQVSLHQHSKQKQHICGGAILNESFILTAVHCLFDGVKNVTPINLNDFFIVVGQTELKLNPNSVIRYIKKSIAHPRYQYAGDQFETRFQHDLVLLELEEKLPPFTKLIQPIKLNHIKVVDGVKCTVTGWGALKSEKYILNTREVAETLKKHVYSTITRYNCINIHKDDEYRENIPDGSFCTIRDDTKFEHAYAQLADDNGGPLVCNGLLAGIVSSGTNHLRKFHIAIHIDIQQHLSWIQNLRDTPINKHDPKDKNSGGNVSPGSTAAPVAGRKAKGKKSSSPKYFCNKYLIYLVTAIVTLKTLKH